MDNKALFYTAIATAGTWAAVLCAFLIVWLQTRAAKRLASLQLFIQLAAQYDSDSMQRIRARLAAKLLSDASSVDLEDSLMVFYENLAILTRRRLLDLDLVSNTFSFDVRCYWIALRHCVAQSRTEFSDPTLFEEFEQLNDYFLRSKYSPMGTRLGQVAITPETAQHFLRYEALRGGSIERA